MSWLARRYSPRCDALLLLFATLSNAKTLYDVLGIPSSASRRQIESAYRKKTRVQLPSNLGGGGMSESISAALSDISEVVCMPTDVGCFADALDAHDVLSDPAQRKKYDERLASKAQLQAKRDQTIIDMERSGHRSDISGLTDKARVREQQRATEARAKRRERVAARRECVQRASAGECASNPDFMLEHCRDACNNDPPNEPPPILPDDIRAICHSWASVPTHSNEHQLVDHPCKPGSSHYSYMMKHCPVACKSANKLSEQQRRDNNWWIGMLIYACTVTALMISIMCSGRIMDGMLWMMRAFFRMVGVMYGVAARYLGLRYTRTNERTNGYTRPHRRHHPTGRDTARARRRD